MEGLDLMEEQGRNGTEDDGEILAKEHGTWEQNITREGTNTTSPAGGKGIFGRMNLDFLFGEQGDEVRAEGEEAEDQIEEEVGIDDGSTCCPAPSNPCEVIFVIFFVFSSLNPWEVIFTYFLFRQ